jgi:hypothetical protein
MEARVVAAALACAALFRVFCMTRAPIDSDEPQHLHVAWMWWNGLIGYRDFFDNHMPLFHMTVAPLLGLIGERSDVFWIARLLMLPLGVGVIVASYFVARRMYGPVTGFWCAITVSLFPPLVLKGVEFRNDNATVLLAIAAVVVLLPGLTPPRVFLGSLLLGIGFVTSIKTGILVAALFLAVASTHRLTVRLVAPAVGFFIAPGLMAAFFAWNGALRNFVFSVFEFNRMYPSNPARTYGGALAFLPVVALVLILARRWKTTRERRIVALTSIFFIVLTLCFWPLITTRDWLPVLPLVAIIATAALVTRWPALAPALPLALILWTVEWGTLWRTPSRQPLDLVAETQRLTRPQEPVLDIKGETIYRKRASFYTLDRVGRTLVRNGLMPDTFAGDVVANRCFVVAPDSNYWPRATRQFLRRHFLEGNGLLRVAGQRIGADRRFEIVVPGRYSLVGAQQSRYYSAGTYVAPPGARAVIWSPALERGFTLPSSAARAAELPPGPSKSAQSRTGESVPPSPGRPLRAPRSV